MVHALKRSATALAVLLAVVCATASPASAHTLGSAVTSSTGCGWSNGAYTILHSSTISVVEEGRQGTVYLLWNGTYGQNCVVTLKTGPSHGTQTWTWARLYIRTASGGYETRYDEGDYAHYAAKSASTRGVCVAYQGGIEGLNGQDGYAGRTEYGNCG
ncbi:MULTISPECIES: hypothetical protein [unclassified Nocardiopsis]|uniref:hypothetical protein n=1 Tax=unclassified Nocardiopsis TaxID=2649073 RepID=UPI001359FC1B|nr:MULTISPECIES: hypothetical protein [unclassified Nocardiopsis]